MYNFYKIIYVKKTVAFATFLTVYKRCFMTWSDNQVAELKVMWGDGMSCSQISRVLNKKYPYQVSRSAVIGKVHRLGLTGRTPRVSPQRTYPPKPPKQKRQPPTPLPPTEPITPVVWTDGQPGVPLVESTKEHCSLIEGEPTADARVCGHKRLEGSPYCQGHTAICNNRAGTMKSTRKARGKYADWNQEAAPPTF